MSRDLQRSTNVVARALAAMHQHRSAAPSGAYQAPKPPALPAGHGFWDNSRKLLDAPSTRIQRERTALWTGSRRSVVQISSFGGNLWRERTVTFGSRGRRPEGDTVPGIGGRLYEGERYTQMIVYPLQPPCNNYCNNYCKRLNHY